MKKWISMLLVVAVLLNFTGCAGKAEQENAETVQNVQQAEDTPLLKTARYLQEKVPEPSYGSVAGEWVALGFARSALEGMEDYLLGYGERVATHTAEKAGVLHEKKYTEYSRVILAWTAIGRDATNVGGFNLLIPLGDFEKTIFQGINGPVFALLALDSGSYEMPENPSAGTQATREMYVDHILRAELTDGGWSLGGATAEIDMTAMALQALAKYRDRPDVEKAVERGLEVLSSQQNTNGGFTSQDKESSEAVSQTIVALTELGISLDDPRFIKNNNTLKDALVRFQKEDGSFSHLLNESPDLLATEQAFYALVAIDRMEQGKTSLYTMK